MATQPKPVMTLTLDNIPKLPDQRGGAENGHHQSNGKPGTASTDTVNNDKCGCGVWRPDCLQKLARPGVYLASICCLFLAQSQLISGYISSILTTLERRYDLSSSQVGMMLSSFDGMAVFAVFVVSYIGDQFNRAHLLGYGALCMSLGAAVFCMPQWFGEDYDKYGRNQYTTGSMTDRESQNRTLSDVNICNHTGT